MAVCVHEAGFDPALKNCLHAAPWSLSESLTGSDEWDVLRAVINFPPPCYEHIDLCSMWSALESAVAARSRHWAPGAVAKETKNRADKCLKRFWERKSSFVCVLYHQFKSHRCHSDSWNRCIDFDNENFNSEAPFKAWKWPLPPTCSMSLFRFLQKWTMRWRRMPRLSERDSDSFKVKQRETDDEGDDDDEGREKGKLYLQGTVSSSKMNLFCQCCIQKWAYNESL